MKKLILIFPLFLILGGCSQVGETFNQKGVAAFHQNRFEEAALDFHWAAFFQNQDAVDLNDEGYAFYLAKDFDKAQKALQKAQELTKDPKLTFQIQLNLALLYCDPAARLDRRAGKDWLPRGIGLFQNLLGSDPRNAELWMRLGFADFQNSNPGGGFMELEKACSFAAPQYVALYTADPVGGSLLILRQVHAFYIKIRYFKKADEVQKKISTLEKRKRKFPTSS